LHFEKRPVFPNGSLDISLLMSGDRVLKQGFGSLGCKQNRRYKNHRSAKHGESFPYNTTAMERRGGANATLRIFSRSEVKLSRELNDAPARFSVCVPKASVLVQAIGAKNQLQIVISTAEEGIERVIQEIVRGHSEL
jgi:hypothetical protein